MHVSFGPARAPSRLVVTLVGLSAALIATACADDTFTVELTVVDTLPVDFETMAADIAEGAEISLASLAVEPAYTEVVAELACGALDAAESAITVEVLDVGPGATVLTYEVFVAAQGGPLTPLALFDGSVSEGDRIALSDDRVVLYATGLHRIADVILSDAPALDLSIQARVPGDLNDLQVALSLAQRFSSDPRACPDPTTGLPPE